MDDDERRRRIRKLEKRIAITMIKVEVYDRKWKYWQSKITSTTSGQRLNKLCTKRDAVSAKFVSYFDMAKRMARKLSKLKVES